jgi:hypothetical protein
MPGQVLGDLAGDPLLDFLVIMLAQLAERARRCDDDQAVIFVAQRPLLQKLRGLGRELVLLELVIVGLLIGRAPARALAGEGAARLVALLVAVPEVGLPSLRSTIRLGKSLSPSFRKKRDFLPSATITKLLWGTRIPVSFDYPSRSTRQSRRGCPAPARRS